MSLFGFLAQDIFVKYILTSSMNRFMVNNKLMPQKYVKSSILISNIVFLAFCPQKHF